jgi:vanillate O-demethylase ferredoxin subunit
MAETIEVLVQSITNLAEGINAWEFCRPDGGDLPPFAAGAHIDLTLRHGMSRSYSLCNTPDERFRYVVAVQKDVAGRGGSRFVHENLRAGDKLRISSPRNHFQLVESADHVVLIAGGIGITPIWCMVQRLMSLGRSWELHYSARLRRVCAFRQKLEVIAAAIPGCVHFNFDQEPGGRMTDIAALIAATPAGAHLFCCGPVPMLEAFKAAASKAGIPGERVHLEYFSAAQEAALQGGYTVELRRSRKVFAIPEGKSILDVLLDADVDAPFSCMQGTCGTCEVAVLDGVPDHRDAILTEAERAASETMMICCSGSKSKRLVIDL